MAEQTTVDPAMSFGILLNFGMKYLIVTLSDIEDTSIGLPPPQTPKSAFDVRARSSRSQIRKTTMIELYVCERRLRFDENFCEL
jgi:hypothetical protein